MDILHSWFVFQFIVGFERLVFFGCQFVDYYCFGNDNQRQSEVDVIDLEAAPSANAAGSLRAYGSPSHDVDTNSCPKRSFANGLTNEDGNEVPSQLHIALALTWT